MQNSTQNLELICFRDGVPRVAFFLRDDRATTIGRSTENVVVLNDERCSRFHAAIEFRNGRWYLADMGRNGTLVDGKKAGKETEIFIGTKIQIGREILIVEAVRDVAALPREDAADSAREVDARERRKRDDESERAAVERGRDELTARLHVERTENRRLRGLLELLERNSETIGESEAMRRLRREVERAARSKATVLIRGESGVGKELVARATHERSARRSGPMICLNCAAFSESLLTSELFGHERGAFTGALETKIGKFEAADGGTIFLDEIAEMNPALQATFLRVLEGATFERVGGNEPISVDVRVVAATNRDLEAEVAAGRFRGDLYFRLRVLEIFVPPLREREGDVDLLADYFLNKFSQETGRRYLRFSPEARAALNAYRWPGNVRELKNAVERAVLMGNPPTIEREDLSTSPLASAFPSATPARAGAGSEIPNDVSNAKRGADSKNDRDASNGTNDPPRETTGKRVDDEKTERAVPFVPVPLKEMEREHILKTLIHFNWNKSRSAKALGVERTTLDRKIAAYSLVRPES